MITGNLPTLVTKETQERLKAYNQAVRNTQWRIYSLREHFRVIDLAYQREQDLTVEQGRAKLANRYGDATKFQNITVPIVMPQVESAVTYQSSVFLTQTPLFEVLADPSQMDVAEQMETIIDNQSTQGNWVSELTQIFRDAFKYNFYALEVDWGRITVPSFETSVSNGGKEAKVNDTIWEGNRLKRLDPYNTLFDIRIHPARMHLDGEYAGYTELMSRIKFKAFLAELGDAKIIDNVKAAFESGLGEVGIAMNATTSPYYVPSINPDLIINRNFGLGEFDWMQWAGVDPADTGVKFQYKNVYRVTTLYARILPTDFAMKVPGKNTAQIWKFIFVNDEVLIYAARQTNAHSMLPILFGQGAVDGLGIQTKSLATNELPFQQLSSALWNSTIAAQRRNISDRMLYDPSRVSESRINDPNPAAKIPVRPAAYGKPLGEAVYPFPFRNDNLDDVLVLAKQVDDMANKLARSNEAKQGQFVKGNKSRSEFDTIMANASGEDQLRAIQFEHYLFRPLKEIIKLNILQYQGAEDLLNTEQQKVVTIDPIKLRKAVFSFKVSDGLVPRSKLANTEVVRDSLQNLANMPQVAAGYNMTPMFSYLMKIQGAEIDEFEKASEQIAFEQAMVQWQQLVVQLVKANPAIQPNQYPPQPLPADYNYDPSQNVKSETEDENTNAGLTNLVSAAPTTPGGGITE